MNLPNLITFSRVPALFVVVGLMFAPFHGAATAVFVLFVLGAITDWLDGYLARRFHSVSNFGKLMDALTDKVLIVGVMVAMLVPLPDGMPLLPDWALFLVLITITREFLITGLRLVAASQGRVLAAERSGKIKMVLQLVSISVLLFGYAVAKDFSATSPLVPLARHIGEVLFVLAAVLTAASGAGYLIKYWDIFMGQTERK